MEAEEFARSARGGLGCGRGMETRAAVVNGLETRHRCRAQTASPCPSFPPSRHNLAAQFRTSFPYLSIHQQSAFGTNSLIILSFSTCRHVFHVQSARQTSMAPPPATPILGTVGRAQLHACIPATLSPRVEWTPYAPAQCHVVKKFGRLKPVIACITSMAAVIIV